MALPVNPPQWYGGPNFIVVPRGSNTGGINNSKPVGRRKTRFLAVLQKSLHEKYGKVVRK